MGQVTQPQRVQRIKQLLAELNKVPPERHEVVRLPGTGPEPRLCQVILIGVDEVLLNHQSHRVRAQLEDDPEWSGLKQDPHSEAAQRVIERHVAKARTVEEFAALKESLQREGQADPGVMTHTGVLVNANTRVVALRELEDPAKRYIRVAVLPETVHPDELALLELRLQMQKELKVDYSLTNELLFIEELAVRRRLKDAQIARELRVFPESPKKGENEVRLRLRMLDLIRQMQLVPADRLALTFFDKLGYEQLRDLHRSYHALVEQDSEGAQRHLESFLLSVAVGVTPVHQIRRIDPEFIPDYMLPQLKDDEVLGAFADKLATVPAAEDPDPTGVGTLFTGSSGAMPEVNIRGLIDLVTQRDKRVKIAGTSIVLDRDDIRDAVKTAIITGIKEKRRDESADDRLQAPIDALKEAIRQLDRCAEACKIVANDTEFDLKRKKSFEVTFKKLKRTCRHLETGLLKLQILPE